MPTRTIDEWERDRETNELAAAVEAAEAIEPVPVRSGNIAERAYAGLRVSLDWNEALGTTVLVQVGEQQPVVFAVPKEHALDAYEHPFAYLPEELREHVKL